MTKLTSEQLSILYGVARFQRRDIYLSELAKMIGYSADALFIWAKRGLVPSYRKGSHLYVPMAKLKDWEIPEFSTGRQLRFADVRQIRAKQRGGMSYEDVWKEYSRRLSKEAFKRVWDGISYKGVI